MRKWKVYLLHHTHFDIGYTHTQEEVFQIQNRNLDGAMRLIEENKNRPDPARFRWNPEVTFTVTKWLEQATQSEINQFIEMVKSGYIGLDGFYAGMLTGLCRPEELAQVFAQKKELENRTGIRLDSAMITDIPGWNWGLTTALAESGIKYLSSGPNGGDRIGYILSEWADKPFYWISPSGKERILLWVHGKGYAWFHTGLNYEKKMKNKLKPGRVRRYLRALEKSGYPYDSIIIRYNIGADNGPPDENLSQIVEEWNESIEDIKLEISTTSKAMAEFEADYGSQLPEYRGDFTPYWEDGAFSTSRETAINREASERLTQAQTLFALSGQKKNRELEKRTWDDVLLFNEHTWGAYNSISRPNHPFAKSQWAWKRERAIQADQGTRKLLKEAAGGVLETGRFYMDEVSGAKSNDRVTVYNTHSWAISQIVELNSEFELVFDAEDHDVPSQRLSNGRLAFYVKDLPPFSSREYRLADGEPISVEGGCRVDGLQLKNEHLTVEIDEYSGAIRSFICDSVDYVDKKSDDLFNGYVLVPIKTPVFKQRENFKAGVQIEVVDAGPLRATIRVSRKAARTLGYVSEISVDAFSSEVRIENILDRPVSRWKEGIHFSYPFNLPNGVVRYDCAWGTAQLDIDQLPGANRNFITASRWVDVSDEKAGMCCVLLDAPIFKSGPLTRDPWRSGPPALCGWKKEMTYNGALYSYVMNNYWQTNYKADQPGKTLFRYVLQPHGKYSVAENYRLAAENFQPLIMSFGGKQVERGAIRSSHPDVIISSINQSEDETILRLVNISDKEIETIVDVDGAEMGIRMLSAGKEAALSGKRLKLAAFETVVVTMETESYAR